MRGLGPWIWPSSSVPVGLGGRSPHQKLAIAQPSPGMKGTSPAPFPSEAHPSARLLGQGLGDGVEVGFAAQEPMQHDDGRPPRIPVQ